MLRALWCLLLLYPLCVRAAFLDCLFFDGYEAPGTTDAAALAALKVHNCARKTVDPPASSPMPSLAWSATVASPAQTWANNCTYAHGNTNGYGQNLYAAAGFTPTLADAALDWAGEEPYYTYATNTCAPGQDCGHYTQMVWSTTTQVGCGQAFCTQNSPFGASFPNWWLIVCDYNPPGNWLGQWPY